jgi:hypothetical protein
MKRAVLLRGHLDRIILPNGPQPESPGTRRLLQAVLVGNTRDEVRDEEWRRVRVAGHRDCLCLARCGLLGMNGNYTADVLEGLVHFPPHTQNWLTDAAARIAP